MCPTRLNNLAKHVVLPVEGLRTRVRFPPPPPLFEIPTFIGWDFFCPERQYWRGSTRFTGERHPSSFCVSGVTSPEFLKWLTRKGEREHELAMQDKALEFEKIRGAQRMDEIGAGADAAWNVGAIETLRDAVRTQGEKTGVRWADALSSSVRPVITYWFMAL